MKNVFEIKLDIPDIAAFIQIANSITNDVCLYQGVNTVSGKSVMGVYALDLSKPINLIVRDRESNDIVYEKFGKWLTQE